MSKRVLICVGTAVTLMLAAACGFLFGNSMRESNINSEDGLSAYVSSESEESDITATGINDISAQGYAETGSEDTAQGFAETDGTDNLQGFPEATSEGTELNSTEEGSEETAQSASGNDEEQVLPGEYAYIILPENGTLVVYYSDASTIYFDSGIEVENLPEETKIQAKQGIGFQTEEELFGFLESYSS